MADEISVTPQYTKWQQVLYYFRRFLKVAIPLILTEIPLVATAMIDWKTAGILVLVPVLSTADKYARDNGWY
jgi:hypothetical protein